MNNDELKLFFDEQENDRANLIFNDDVKKLILELHSHFRNRKDQLLADRKRKQEHYDQGKYPEYPPKDSEAASGDWKVNSLPEPLMQRKVEICVPANDKSKILSELQSDWGGSSVVIDFEDTLVNTAANTLAGYESLVEAKNSFLSNPDKKYPMPMVRVRNLHGNDNFIKIGNSDVCGAIVDIAVMTYHFGQGLFEKGTNPCIYIPKIEESLESLWWNDVLGHVEKTLDWPNGSIKVTYLIETLPSAYYCEEILYNSRSRAIGLNVGKWDRIFSDIKVFRNRKERIMPDRQAISMSHYWMDNYARRVIKVCHSRGALAIGGLAPQVPDVSEKFKKLQIERFKEEKKYEFNIGHDGTWVMDSFFGKICLDIFKKSNQIENYLEYFSKYPDLIASGAGKRTLKCLRYNIKICLKYISAYLQGNGTIVIKNKIEDLSSLEISRAQVWQWKKHEVILDEGNVVDSELINNILEEEYELIHREIQSSISGEHSASEQEEFLSRAKTITSNLLNDEHLVPYFDWYKF